MENERFAWFSRKRIVYVIIGVAIVVVTIVLIAKYLFNVDLLSTTELAMARRARSLSTYGYDLQKRWGSMAGIDNSISPRTVGTSLIYFCPDFLFRLI